MRIARVLSPIHSLGPGERVCLWTQGCGKNCHGCISPEMQPHTGEEISESDLAKVLISVAEKNNCTGLTISGGDPFEQSEALLRLLNKVRGFFDDILVYTGYKFEELSSLSCGKESLEKIDVIIDGRYMENLNNSSCVLRGSENQNIIFLNSSFEEKYREYMKKGRIIESFSHGQKLYITGILDKED